MEKFTFYWLTGNKNVLEGEDPANALTLAGFGGGSVRALDFYAEGDNKEYKWDANKKRWEKIKK